MTNEEECPHGMTPAYCADCRGLGRLEDEDVAAQYEDVLIERFYYAAKYDQPCALFPNKRYDGHYILKGENFALAVRGSTRVGYICDNCIEMLTRGTALGG
jgi:hypothetical protein